MTTHQSIRAIATMPSLEAVGQAVDQLVLAGFPLAQIFVVGRDTRALTADQLDLNTALPIKELLHQVNVKTMTHTAGDRKRGRTIGFYTGAITGLLAGLGLLAVPGVGEVVLGTVALYLLSLTGIGTVAGGMLGSTLSQKMTRRLLDTYLMHVLQGNYLLLVSGTATAISRAECILSAQGIQGRI